MGNIGFPEILLLLLVALLVFGPKKLPEMARSLGRGVREFRIAVTAIATDDTPAKAPLPVESIAEPVPMFDEGKR